MVNVKFDEGFQRTISKIKGQEMQKSIKNKVRKIIDNPEIGKPLRNVRKGMREVYAGGSYIQSSCRIILGGCRLGHFVTDMKNFVFLL